MEFCLFNDRPFQFTFQFRIFFIYSYWLFAPYFHGNWTVVVKIKVGYCFLILNRKWGCRFIFILTFVGFALLGIFKFVLKCQSNYIIFLHIFGLTLKQKYIFLFLFWDFWQIFEFSKLALYFLARKDRCRKYSENRSYH